ncbi:hypothetical protein glysoja_041846 [Glycine soja]|uniref:Uncharacterized protein n=1 Tax=Glycine soja TaxID=3848 RepID=A0A0B2S649_GLYSO|nr:hypothetical protein glysoja_041846 [Glycine soja]
MPNNSEQCTLNNHNQLVAKTKKPHVGPTIPSHLIASTFTITTSAPHHNKHLSAAVARYQNLVKSEHHHPLVPSGANISTNIPPLKSLILTVLDPNAGLVHDPLRSPFLGHPHCKDHVGRHARTGDILPACIGQPYVRCSGGAGVGFPTLRSPWYYVGYFKELFSSEGLVEDSGSNEHEQAQRVPLARHGLAVFPIGASFGACLG